MVKYVGIKIQNYHVVSITSDIKLMLKSSNVWGYTLKI